MLTVMGRTGAAFWRGVLNLRGELSNLLKEHVSVIGVGNELDGREKVEGEDTHNGLGVDGVSALNEVYLVVNEDNAVYKLADILNVGERNHHFLHWLSFLSVFVGFP